METPNTRRCHPNVQRVSVGVLIIGVGLVVHAGIDLVWGAVREPSGTLRDGRTR